MKNRGSGEWYHAVRTESAACAVRYRSPPPTQLRQFPDRQLPDPSPGEGEDGVAHGGGDRRGARAPRAPLGIRAPAHLKPHHRRLRPPGPSGGIGISPPPPGTPAGELALQGPPRPQRQPAPPPG